MKTLTVVGLLVLLVSVPCFAGYSYHYQTQAFGGFTIPMTPVYIGGGILAPTAVQYGIGRVWKNPSLKAKFAKVFIAHLGTAAVMYYLPGRTRFIPRTLNSDPGDPAGTNFVMSTFALSLPIQSLWTSWKGDKQKGRVK